MDSRADRENIGDFTPANEPHDLEPDEGREFCDLGYSNQWSKIPVSDRKYLYLIFSKVSY